MRRWWLTKLRQTRAHILARVSPAERAALGMWLTPAQGQVFDRMHPADQRHGLDVVAALRAGGANDPDLLLAGLLHDAAKGRGVRLAHRVAFSLGEAYGSWVWRLASLLPTFGDAMNRLHEHAELSARLAAWAGCNERTIELIRRQDRPDGDAGSRLLRLADEAN